MIEMIDFIAVYEKNDGNYAFKSVSLDPSKISGTEEDTSTKRALLEGRFPEELLPETEFTLVFHEGRCYTVVGDKETVTRKISSRKRILRG